MDKALAVLGLLLLAGCVPLSSYFHDQPPVPVGIPCSAGPIVLDRADHLTRATAEQIIALDNAGEALCGWRAPGGKP